MRFSTALALFALTATVAAGPLRFRQDANSTANATDAADAAATADNSTVTADNSTATSDSTDSTATAAAADTCDLKGCITDLASTVTDCKTALAGGINFESAISCISSALKDVAAVPAACSACASVGGILKGVEGLI
ncbi:hypothetical protein B0H11DRAFT_2275446 [Mycena galericulata]|nr:hypothetical protein B0H11DRAFT_2275446 [Mycena galericulata]